MRQIMNFVYCTFGALLVAVAVVVFLAPNHIAAGGPAGISIILFHKFGVSKGLVVFLVNALLMAVGLRLLGMLFLIRTCYAVVAQSLLIELLNHVFAIPPVTAGPLLSTIYGGALVGIGVALIFRGEAASGGWTLVARILANRLKLGVGQVVLLLDTCVVIASGVAFGDIEAALWAGIGIYVTGVVIDLALNGPPASKVIHISTNQSLELSRLFAERLHDDGSVVHCNTLKDAAGHELMLLVVDRWQVDKLKHIVREVDREAHVVVMDAGEFFSGGRLGTTAS